MRIAKDLLIELTKRIPPANGKRHNITLDDNGDLIVTLSLDRFWSFELDDDEMLMSGEIIAGVIEASLPDEAKARHLERS